MDHVIDMSGLGFDASVGREWLVTNGLGGYASSTVPCLNSRKYHGLLVAAMTPPVRRMVLLSRLEETVYLDGWPSQLACNEYPGAVHPEGHRLLRAFSNEPFPRWGYQGDGWTLEKSLCLLRGQNTVCVTYTLLGGTRPVDLHLRPLFALRGIHELSYQWNGPLTAEPKSLDCWRVPPTSRTPEVFFAHEGTFEKEPGWYFNTIYRREQERGYGGLEDLWTPGGVRVRLAPGHSTHFVCSADPIDRQTVIEQARLQRSAGPVAYVFPDSPAGRAAHGLRRELAPTGPTSGSEDADLSRWRESYLTALTRAAEQFIARVPQDDSAERATALVTHLPWSPPSGRDALIAFPGVFLATGRFEDGRSLLLSFAGKLADGLMPSEFPENGTGPVYHGADVSLWYVAAVLRYLQYTGDEWTVRRHLYEPVLRIVQAYRAGTAPGVRADDDGLLQSGTQAVATTWMDATLAGVPVTPRQGRPVELNALWYNALRTAALLAERFGDVRAAADLSVLARSVRSAFNRQFWNDPAGCCFDVVADGGVAASDGSVRRPNQLLAAGLPFPVLDDERHARLLDAVRAELLTPMGVRSLSPRDAGYQGHYRGNADARDRAQHNGPAYPWLLGPFVTAYVRSRGGDPAARREAEAMLRPCLSYLCGDGLGQLSELADGDTPHTPGGAPASAPAVGALLRCYVEDVLNAGPAPVGAEAPGDATGAGRQPLEIIVSPLPRG